MASSLLLQPRPFLPPKPSLPSASPHGHRTISLSLRSNTFCSRLSSSSNFTVRASASAASAAAAPVSYPPRITESTRTVASLLAAALSLSLSVSKLLQRLPIEKVASLCLSFLPSPQELAALRSVAVGLGRAAGPAFFAALRDRPSGYLNTPLTVVAAGLSKWLDIYSGVLMVRVLLSWFPNIPWERQPLSAIRDLCDPYLNLFRNIIPPIFDTLDVSPLLAFAVLGTLGSILNNSRGMY